ncbi:MAG TPA: helix-turn-helix domain-containing protein [Candidatus Binatia bacterium]|nr:helix-turn-helix domain-containing protein [Candidatus Binatia bacterium]
MRIAENGLRLFVKDGFEATTLEAVATAAGISARTLFYYFRTKEELLQYWRDDSFFTSLGPTLAGEAREKSPLQATRDTILKLVSRYETDRSIVVDQMMQSTEALRARKQASFVEMEAIVYRVLRERYPDEKSQMLRTISMLAFGALRLAMEKWREDGAARQLAKYVRAEFDLLRLALVPRRI